MARARRLTTVIAASRFVPKDSRMTPVASARYAPCLVARERDALEHHLAEAERLLRKGAARG